MPADRPDPLLLANQTCFALYAAQHAMTRVYRPLLEAIGLTYPQYIVMLLLWEEDGPAVKGLGERLGLDSGTLTPLLKRLEGQGLVRRTRDPVDERIVRIHLTAEGKALREKAVCMPERILAASGRSPAELAALREELLRLRTALDRAAGQTG
ncbi:MarR family transcriptional regulator [Azospirillum sp. RWY-5-1]|uniref:MarR family transcriptional regulator n=1 Tax=Azospirillum oleiclasticum TaxID=2735135 RepID=A0ABX2TIT5_9PROT|nr:MarR family transcriptional regulator [Azospirillum oleiclasticum]NYZ16676.1 MarR family transcriptional regulator [Azospirillum oleiclasticum]NYZ24163.1 MarR family transcriptional regulator [Azospirillum oleiclasticum]